MLVAINDFFAAVYELVGDFGLTFFLIIIAINIYFVYWYLPKKAQNFTSSEDAKATNRVSKLKIIFGIPSIVVSTFTVGILMVSGPALWVKVISGIVSVALIVCILISVWLFVTTKGHQSIS